MAKTYFVRQKEAFSNTFLLCLLYFLGILIIPCIIILIEYFISEYCMHGEYDIGTYIKHYYWITGGCGLISIIASFFYYKKFSRAGSEIAKSFGAIPIEDLEDTFEIKQLKHIIEEISLASGVNKPSIFILEEETINAFAAGNAKNFKSAICVTSGSLEKLQRSELTGVISHEFSHLANNDTKINALLCALIGGFSFIKIIGISLLKSIECSRVGRNNKEKGTGAILLIGVVLIIIGFLWSSYAKIIKAAISRQREFLADATAVAYTKDDSIAIALVKIKYQFKRLILNDKSYKNKSKKLKGISEIANHMFFTNLCGLSSLFDSHPNIDDRIKRAREMTFSGPQTKINNTNNLDG